MAETGAGTGGQVVDDEAIYRAVYGLSREEVAAGDAAFAKRWPGERDGLLESVKLASGAPALESPVAPPLLAAGPTPAANPPSNDALGDWAKAAPMSLRERLAQARAGFVLGVAQALERARLFVAHAQDDFASARGWTARFWRWRSSPYRGAPTAMARSRELDRIHGEGARQAQSERESPAGAALVEKMRAASLRAAAICREDAPTPSPAEIRDVRAAHEDAVRAHARLLEDRDALAARVPGHAAQKALEMEAAKRVVALLRAAFGSDEAGHRAYAKLAHLSRREARQDGEASGRLAAWALTRDIHSLGPTPGVYVLGRPISRRAQEAWSARRELVAMKATGFEVEELYRTDARHELLRACHEQACRVARDAAPFAEALDRQAQSLDAMERRVAVQAKMREMEAAPKPSEKPPAPVQPVVQVGEPPAAAAPRKTLTLNKPIAPQPPAPQVQAPARAPEREPEMAVAAAAGARAMEEAADPFADDAPPNPPDVDAPPRSRPTFGLVKGAKTGQVLPFERPGQRPPRDGGEAR